MTIPNPEENRKPRGLSDEIAERPQEEEAPEALPIFISFAKYKPKECDIDGMDTKIARKALKAIRDVGVEIKGEDDFKTKLPKLDVEAISNSGDYRKLYSGMSPDIQIKEAKIDKDKGRLFFFMVDRIFYIIAIKDSHYETDKQRR